MLMEYQILNISSSLQNKNTIRASLEKEVLPAASKGAAFLF